MANHKVDSPDLTDPVLYPKLTREQVERVGAFAVCRQYKPGEVLFDQGQRDAPLVVIESGAVDLIDRRPTGDVPFAHVGAGNFLGDTSMFTGQPTIAAAVAAEPTRALVVGRERLRELVAGHSDIGDVLLAAFLARRAWLEGHGYGLAGLIGSAISQDAYKLRQFLDRNQVPYRWYDVDADDGSRALLDKLGVGAHECPVLVCGTTSRVKRNPTVACLADHLGLRPDPGDGVYDVAVVGAGPGGLAAAVYAASEGLTSVVLEADSPGGQAGTSSKIENYLGFLTGISGTDLTRQAVLQARKFGAVMTSPRAARGLEHDGHHHAVVLDGGKRVKARTVVIATGAEYRRLECPSCADFEGRGVFYAASRVEAVHCAKQDVAVAGGGNSAGQAVVYLAGHARKVYLIVRRGGLEDTMSRYLIARIERLPNVETIAHAEVAALHGDDRLRAIDVCVKGDPRRVEVAGLFAMIGAVPRTNWLGDSVLRDGDGFVLTGDELRKDKRFAGAWKLDRDPYLLETSAPGVFAAGDARCGSVKRVAAAVGEGSMAVTFAHRRLAELAPKPEDAVAAS